MSELDGGLPDNGYGQTSFARHDPLIGDYLGGKGPNPFAIDWLKDLERDAYIGACGVLTDEATEEIP